MALIADILAKITATQTGPNDFGADKFRPQVQAALALTDGTGANQANILFADQRTVASASNDDIDLVGVLTDAFGATITAAELVAILIINVPISGPANTTSLTIGGGSNPVAGFLGGTTPTIGPMPGRYGSSGLPDGSGTWRGGSWHGRHPADCQQFRRPCDLSDCGHRQDGVS